MAKVCDVLAFLDTIAPTDLKMDWDNVGLLCGRREAQIHKILVALDPFEDVCREAAQVGADLIVTHHPLIFSPLKAVTADDAVGRSILFLAARGISAVNAHTNLDRAPGGVNDRLAQALGLEDVQTLDPAGAALIRTGKVYPQPLDTFLATAKDKLGCKGLRFADGSRPVHQVAVGGGACASALAEVAAAGCDTFVTADVKYNQFQDARDLHLNLIDAGHFPTEAPIVAVLAQKLAETFPSVAVQASQTNRDCIHFF